MTNDLGSQAPAAATAGHSSWTVLVVEDEALVAMEIKHVVEALGFAIRGPAARLNEALAVAEVGDFDCAVLDYNIRGGNTLPIAELLLARGCPFVMATGYGGLSLPAHIAAQRRLTKPFDSAMLEAELWHMHEEFSARTS